MNETNGQPEFASDFIQSLVDEIERLIADRPLVSTEYRGADLRQALARSLYFQFANDEACRRDWQSGPGWLAHRFATCSRRSTAVLSVPRAMRDLLLDLQWRYLYKKGPSCRNKLVFAFARERFAHYLQAIGFNSNSALFYCGLPNPRSFALSFSDIPLALPSTLRPWRRYLDWKNPDLQVFALQRQLDIHLAFLERERPRAVVVVEGNAPFDEVLNQACKLTDIPCICIQQGWSPIIHTGFRHLSFTKMLVWGEDFGRLLSSYSPGQRFVATGNHLVGCEARSVSSPRNAISFFLQARSPMIHKKVLDDFFVLIRRIGTACPNLRMLVRDHPTARMNAAAHRSLDTLKNVEWVNPATSSLHDQLTRSRVSVSLFSTTLLESVACGSVPVAVNPGILRQFIPSLAESGVGVEASTWNDAEAAIIKLCTDQQFYEAHVSQHADFVHRFFNGATREESKEALRIELTRI